ncbi:MAG: DUF5615 family PIN-like protein [Bacteroidota bacterium]
MKFIVDAQLPQSLAQFLRKRGHDAIHTIELPKKNKTSDKEVIEISFKEERIVVSKDNDFLETFIITNLPKKLLIVSTGNISNEELLSHFEESLEQLNSLFSDNHVVEIDKERITVHY